MHIEYFHISFDMEFSEIYFEIKLMLSIEFLPNRTPWPESRWFPFNIAEENASKMKIILVISV